MDRRAVNQISALGLAHCGDAVFELLVRSFLCASGKALNGNLHRATVDLVCAPAQAARAERMLPLLTEAAEKCSEYGSVRFSDLLSVYSGCVLLGYEKVNMKRFCEKLVKNGIRDFVFDTLTRCLVPEWDLTEDTVFPKIKEWIVSRHGNTIAPEAVTALKELSSISGNVLVVDAIMKI